MIAAVRLDARAAKGDCERSKALVIVRSRYVTP